MRLRGERALVTGATSGIGRAIAHRFATEGAAVVVNGRSEARGRAVVSEIEAAGGSACFVAADLVEADAPGSLVAAAVDRLGGLSVLVHAATGAGPATAGTVADVDPAAFEAVLAVDVVAVARLCQAALPSLRAARGSIVLVSSRAAVRGTPGLAAYSAAKGGLNALARSIAVDEAPWGVRCCSLSPGYVLHDERDADLAADPERLGRLAAMHLTRLATGADVAAAALFLASREAEVITGIDLPVDGGSTIARAATFG